MSSRGAYPAKTIDRGMLYSEKANIRLHVEADNKATALPGQAPRSIITATYVAEDHEPKNGNAGRLIDWSLGNAYRSPSSVDESVLGRIDDWKISNSKRKFRLLTVSHILRKGQRYGSSSYLFIFEHVIETIESEALKAGPVKVETHLRRFGNLLMEEEL